MPSSSLFLGVGSLFLSSLLAPVSATKSYALEEAYQGADFFKNFDFFNTTDPTNGFVNYYTYDGAKDAELVKILDGGAAYMGVDHANYYKDGGPGRPSVRITSKKVFNKGLFIADIKHMPDNTCGTWPAFWSVGSGDWPNNGEIDIIEGINNQANNLMVLHTSASCSVDGTGQAGDLGYASCSDPTGCTVHPPASVPNTYGADFNSNGGGVYAMEWTSASIKMWFFPRGSVPDNIKNEKPDISKWGTPLAKFSGSCDIDAKFKNHQFIFDTTFCGAWGGPQYPSTCPGYDFSSNPWASCVNYVGNNPTAFKDTYWAVNYFKSFQLADDVQTTSSSSSSSSSVSTSASSSSSSSAASTSASSSSSSSAASTSDSSSSSSATTSSSSSSVATTSSSSSSVASSSSSSSSVASSSSPSSSVASSSSPSSSVASSSSSSSSVATSSSSSSSSSIPAGNYTLPTSTRTGSGPGSGTTSTGSGSGSGAGATITSIIDSVVPLCFQTDYPLTTQCPGNGGLCDKPRTTVTKTITSTYVAPCETGLTTKITTLTVTFCPDDVPTATPIPGFTRTTTVCSVCGPQPTTVTLTLPTTPATSTGAKVPPYPSGTGNASCPYGYMYVNGSCVPSGTATSAPSGKAVGPTASTVFPGAAGKVSSGLGAFAGAAMALGLMF